MKSKPGLHLNSIAGLFRSGAPNSLRAYLVKGATGSLILKISYTVLGLLTGVIMARLLGAAGFGKYAYAMALVNIITIPTVMGLPQLIVRDTAAYCARKDYGMLRGLLIRANQFVFGFSILTAAVAAAVAVAFADRFDPAGLQTFLIALLLLPILGLKNLRMATLRGLRHVVLGLMPELLLRPILFILILAAGVFFLPHGVTPQSAMTFQVVATGIAFVAGALILVYMLPKPAKEAVAVYNTRAWLKSAMPFMVLGAMQLVNNQTAIIMLGIFRPVAEVGVLRAVIQGASLIVFVLNAVNMALAPVISGLYAKNDLKRLQRLVTLSARAILAGTLPIVLVLTIAGHWVMVTLFGPEFGVGATALRILCLGQLVNAGTGSVGIILNMTGHERLAVWGVAVAAVSNIIINLLLIPGFGMTGAAMGAATSVVISNLLLTWWVFKKVGVISLAFGWEHRRP